MAASPWSVPQLASNLGSVLIQRGRRALVRAGRLAHMTAEVARARGKRQQSGTLLLLEPYKLLIKLRGGHVVVGAFPQAPICELLCFGVHRSRLLSVS